MVRGGGCRDANHVRWSLQSKPWHQIARRRITGDCQEGDLLGTTRKSALKLRRHVSVLPKSCNKALTTIFYHIVLLLHLFHSPKFGPQKVNITKVSTFGRNIYNLSWTVDYSRARIPPTACIRLPCEQSWDLWTLFEFSWTVCDFLKIRVSLEKDVDSCRINVAYSLKTHTFSEISCSIHTFSRKKTQPFRKNGFARRQ